MNKGFYTDGEEVRIGDKVKTLGSRFGTVIQIVEKGSASAANLRIPNGGVVIKEMWPDCLVSGNRVISFENDYDWDDVRLIERYS